jgi:large subunit ribosomal protein L16
MGKGKGAVDHWVAVVKPGTIIYEIGETREHLAKVALKSAAKKLSMKCSFVKR